MTIRLTICALVLFSMLFLSVDLLFAGSKWPSVSGSVRATATVVNPLGIATEGIMSDSSNDALWMVRYPSPDGILMTVQLNGKEVRTLRMEEIISEETENAEKTDHSFSIINPYDRVIQSADNLGVLDGTIVITLISTTQ